MYMDFITKILANLFDSFKAKNPKVAALIIFILGVILYMFQNGLGEFVGADLTKVGEWIIFALAALQGSRTTYLLNK